MALFVWAMTTADFDIVRAAMQSSIYDLARETPLELATHLSVRLRRHVRLKREDLQPGFSFKIRGAYHRMQNLTADERCRGVVTASAGNHAQGVARSAQHLGVPALIVMPTSTPRIKVDAVRHLGAEIQLSGDGFDQALERAQTLCASRGATFIHAFDDLDVIAGQATVGIEIARQCPDDLATVYVPVGGGGLVAGVGAAIKHLRPGVRIVAVEPEGADGFARSMEAGRRVRLERVDAFADGVAVREIGHHSFAIARGVVDEVIRVSNVQICEAIRDVFEECRVLVEPSGALSLAGLIAHSALSPSAGGAVAILSGANSDFDRLSFVVEQSASRRTR